MANQQRCGFIAVVGKPNAGKSTLINELVGAKISIVSAKVQTTRTRVLGIVQRDESQLIFVDTPGLFKPAKNNNLEKAIVTAAWEGFNDNDIILFLHDASKKIDSETRDLLEQMQKLESKKIILVLNKIDKVKRDSLLAMSASLNDIYDFTQTFMVSALKANGIDVLLDQLARLVPESVWHFPEDHITDMPLRLMAAEITREKLFHIMRDELPYGLTVETETWEEFDNGSVKISQTIFINREAHKKMIIGKGGTVLKKIGSQAREELKDIVGSDVHLKLFVKVHENWMNDEERFSLWNLKPNA